jgi:ribosome-associated protein
VAHAALDKQAEGVVVLDLRAHSTVTGFFVICTVGSTPQITAIQEHIEAVLAQHGGTVWHTEGIPVPRTTSQGANPEPLWVLMDCGDVVVHLLDQHARAFYRLEELWADAPRVPVSA